MAPLVSICLPVYNGEQFLPLAIESVLAQTFTDFELLITDDDSQDLSLAIAQDYARKDKRIIVRKNEKNQGLFPNYNTCMSAVQGKLIKLFAQDDVLRDQALERSVAVFHEHQDLSLVAVERRWITRTGELLPLPYALTVTTTYLNGWEAIKLCLLRRANLIGEPSTVMFPRHLIGSGFDCQYYHLGDLEFWFRLLAQGNYYYIHEPLCDFRRHTDSMTDKNIKGLLFALDLLALSDQYAHLILDDGLSEHDLKIAVASDAGQFLQELFVEGKVSLEELLSQLPPDDLLARQLSQFKELAFYALLGGASVRKSSQSQIDELQTQLDAVAGRLSGVLNSKSWRSITMLHKAARRLTGHRHTSMG